MKRVRLRHSVWMQASVSLTFWQRVRLLFGVPLTVHLTMRTERNAGTCGPVTGTMQVGDPPRPVGEPAKGTTDAAAEPGGPGAGAAGG